MNPRERLPFVTRLLHPGRARQVAFLASEHERSGLAPVPAGARTELELECEAGAHVVAGRRVARGAGRIRRLAAAGQRRVHRARSDLAALAAAEENRVLLDGRALTMAGVRSRADTLATTVDGDTRARRLDRASRPLRVIGHVLLLVDALALVIIFAFLLNLDWSRPDPANLITAVALSVFGAAVQAVLAVHLGRRLWAWRHSDGVGAADFPPRSAVIVLAGGFLALISAFAAAAIFLRVQREGTVVEAGELAAALGLVLAASALAAPWCLVAEEAYGPGPDARLLLAAGRILARADRRRRRRERRVRSDLHGAARRLARAEWLLASVVQRVGRDQLSSDRTLLAARGLAWGTTACTAADLRPAPDAVDVARAVLPPVVVGDLRCLTLPVEQLRTAVVAARAEYAAVVDEIDPEELDLVA